MTTLERFWHEVWKFVKWVFKKKPKKKDLHYIVVRFEIVPSKERR